MPALLDFLSLIADRGHSNSSKVVRYGTYAHERNLEITARITNLSGVYVCVICGARVGEEKTGTFYFFAAWGGASVGRGLGARCLSAEDLSYTLSSTG